MKTMSDDFGHGLPDYIDQIISKKLDEQNAISLHANPTNIALMRTQVPIGLTIMGKQILQSKMTGTKVFIIHRGDPSKGYRFLNRTAIQK